MVTRDSVTSNFFLTAFFAMSQQQQNALSSIANYNAATNALGAFPSHINFDVKKIIELWEGKTIKAWQVWLQEAEDIKVHPPNLFSFVHLVLLTTVSFHFVLVHIRILGEEGQTRKSRISWCRCPKNLIIDDHQYQGELYNVEE